ncbi:unnamed protein product [Prorocentrum cordatum]|uniref:Uncharacterized protein n=1 Tax=Prorocentrum cordatum TaxID=2364126 RepID=A0ABN9ULJ8_9DINO|nr:unnamed protein product [Polarella glacialis]
MMELLRLGMAFAGEATDRVPAVESPNCADALELRGRWDAEVLAPRLLQRPGLPPEGQKAACGMGFRSWTGLASGRAALPAVRGGGHVLRPRRVHARRQHDARISGKDRCCSFSLSPALARGRLVDLANDAAQSKFKLGVDKNGAAGRG